MKLKQNKGFSFVEMMLAVGILAGGILLIYKSFFISLDYLQHLTYRLHAVSLMDEKMNQIERIYLDSRQLPMGESKETRTLTFDGHPVDYHFSVDFRSVEDLDDLLELDVTIAWTEGGRSISLSRSSYISNYKPVI